MRTNFVRLLPSVALLLASVCWAELPEKYQYIQDAFPDVTITAVEPSPVKGLLQMYVGAELYYVSEDGKYFISGDIYGLESKQNVTEAARTSARATYLQSLGADDGVMFAAENQKYVVTVFTDIDCPYCRKLHREMADYNDRGISVRYLFFPRRGPGSPSWDKADDVWCAESRQQAMTDAKNGVEFDAPACGTTPVAQHFSLGKQMGITGTPAIFTSEGQLIVGYRSAEELLELLENPDAG
jgi:thiol:disulfide interchange protein DsbC